MTKLFDHFAELEPRREATASAASDAAGPQAQADSSAGPPPPLAADPVEVPIQAFRKAGGKWAKWCAASALFWRNK